MQVGQLEKIIQYIQGLGLSRIKDLQSWRSIDSSDFVLYIKYIITITDYKPRYSPDINLEELDNILDQIAAVSGFLSISLKEKIKNSLLIYIDNILSRIFQVLKSSKAK